MTKVKRTMKDRKYVLVFADKLGFEQSFVVNPIDSILVRHALWRKPYKPNKLSACYFLLEGLFKLLFYLRPCEKPNRCKDGKQPNNY